MCKRINLKVNYSQMHFLFLICHHSKSYRRHLRRYIVYSASLSAICFFNDSMDLEKGKKGFKAPPGVPYQMLIKYLPNKYLKLLLEGKALRPGGIALFPIYVTEMRLL